MKGVSKKEIISATLQAEKAKVPRVKFASIILSKYPEYHRISLENMYLKIKRRRKCKTTSK